MSLPPTKQTPRRRRGDFLIAFACGGFVALMVGAAFAAVPLCSWFCRTTGFAGTTQLATVLPAHTSGRTITVRFDSNVAVGLPWLFEPERRTVDVRLGEVVTIYYAVTNESTRVTVGQAGYNVSPLTVGIYFEKINCFCFTQQTLRPGEKRDMAVVFYVDPKLGKDPEQNDLNNITLSYTFYPVRLSPPTRAGDAREGAVASSATSDQSGPI
ncbi:MAG TPA: cytochrome c oxidase assembly protein [Xanthobacteraceae bacterium]